MSKRHRLRRRELRIKSAETRAMRRRRRKKLTKMDLDGYDTFDWREPWVAQEHDKLNRPLFEEGDPSSTLYFSVLTDMVFEAGKQGILDSDEGWRNMLDVGCGAGWQRIHLGREGLMERMAYTGIDLSEHMVELARLNLAAQPADRRLSNCDTGEPDVFETADLMQYQPARAPCFVMTCGVIELFEDWKAFVRRLASFGAKGILLHKIFFDKRRTYQEVVWSYGGKREARTFILRKEFDEFVEELGYDIACVRHLDEEGYPNYSVLLKRKES